MRRLTIIATVLVALVAAAPAQGAKRSVPNGFYGAIFGGDIENAGQGDKNRTWDLLAAGGAESMRVVFNWEQAQPQRGGPISWAKNDDYVASAARRGMSLLPTVMYAPNWAKQYEHVTPSPPKGTADYAAYLTEAVRRYGPNGTFWTARPDVPKRPVRYWQIWNEPDLSDHWHRTGKWLPNEAKRYGALLRASYRAIRKVDPGAKIVLAGLSNFAWETAAALLKHAGVRGYFHIAAVHMFPGKWRNVSVIVKRFRRALDRGGARGKPVWATEMTWPAAKGQAQVPPWADTPYYRNFVTTEKGSADRLAGAYRLLSDRRFRRANRVERVFWFSAATVYQGNSIWDYTGLLQLRPEGITTKPAYETFRTEARRDEGCVKGASGDCT